jgi:hypothetical protein
MNPETETGFQCGFEKLMAPQNKNETGSLDE